jgi:hypothetical protein
MLMVCYMVMIFMILQMVYDAYDLLMLMICYGLYAYVLLGFVTYLCSVMIRYMLMICYMLMIYYMLMRES